MVRSSQQMKAVDRLPEGFGEVETLDLSRNFRLLMGLQAAGLVLLVVSIWALWQYAYAFNQEAGQILSLRALTSRQQEDGSFLASLPPAWTAGFVAALVGMVVLHEAVHGLFFWLFSGRRPLFGFKGAYAYAALAPGLYLARAPYMVVGAAPLVLLTALGLALVPFSPGWALPGLLFFLVGNISGSVGDLYVLYWLSRMPEGVLLQDYGDKMTAFAPL